MSEIEAIIEALMYSGGYSKDFKWAKDRAISILERIEENKIKKKLEKPVINKENLKCWVIAKDKQLIAKILTNYLLGE